MEYIKIVIVLNFSSCFFLVNDCRGSVWENDISLTYKKKV